MVGSWATFAASFTEDEPLLLHSPEFDDDDPSSYLLYPPGFGPVADWPIDGDNIPMLSGEATAGDPCASGRKGADVVANGRPERASVNGSGVSELLRLSEALSGKVCLTEDRAAAGCGGKDGVVEYMVSGSLDGSVDGESDVGVFGTSDPTGGRLRRLEKVSSKEDGVGNVPPAIVKPEVKLEDAEESNVGNDGSSESESDGSSSSFSSSSSSEESRDDDDNGGKKDRMDNVADFEEGEIRDLDAEELAISSDDEDGGVKGPVRSKNEVEVLPPVPPVNASLEPHHETLPVGIISSIVGTKVIIEGIEKHNPLNEGSILWVTDTRSPLGLVDEIFGPVKNPYYVVRFNSEKEIPVRIGEGTAVSFVMEFANHILNDPALYRRGYDASGENDEEVGDEVEFSDDEKEAEYKRSLRQAKRATDNRRQRDQESHRENKVQFDKRKFSDKRSGFEKGKVVQSVPHNKGAPVSQPTSITTQLQPPLHQYLTTDGFSLAEQPPNVRSQITSAPQQAFSSGQIQAPRQPCHFPGQIKAPAQTSRASDQVQVPSQLSCAHDQIQHLPQPPSILGQLQGPPQQHCIPGQLQALPTSLQQPCIPGQFQGQAPPYVLSPRQPPTLSHCVPGLQAPCHLSNAGGNELTPFQAGHSCLSVPSAAASILYGGQLVAPSDLAQTNALWATQQFIAGMSGMFQNNGVPPQQQDLHLFHHQNQNKLFPGFNAGMPLLHHLISNHEVLPNMMSWEGSLPNPSVGSRSLESMAQGLHGQTPWAHTNTGQQGGLAFPSQDRSHGQSDIGAAQGVAHAPAKFNVGSFSSHGRKPFGRGWRARR